MTEEMLALARANAAQAGATNVEFLIGTIESIPLPASTVDVAEAGRTAVLTGQCPIDALRAQAHLRPRVPPAGPVFRVR